MSYLTICLNWCNQVLHYKNYYLAYLSIRHQTVCFKYANIFQNKELKLKLQDIESSQRAKSKTAIASLESKLAQLEEQLEEETR